MPPQNSSGRSSSCTSPDEMGPSRTRRIITRTRPASVSKRKGRVTALFVECLLNDGYQGGGRVDKSQIERRGAVQLKKRAGVVPPRGPTTPDLTSHMNRPDFRQKFIERQPPSPFLSTRRGSRRDAQPFVHAAPPDAPDAVHAAPPDARDAVPCPRSAPVLARHRVLAAA